MSLAYWVHVLQQMAWGFAHIRGTGPLWHWYLSHHGTGLLRRSGITSETPRTYGQARGLLWWLVTHRVNPVDW